MTSTIYALASGSGRAGVAVVRVSGPEAFAVGRALAGALPEARRAGLRRLRNAGGETLDDALVIAFAGPGSFRGEDVVEFHVHGGAAVIEAVSDALEAAGAEPAGAGAFSRRAVEHGKLDLTQAEGIADLVDAETPAQRRLALAQMGGALARLYGAWRDALLGAGARLAAAVDFPDEGDVPPGVATGAAPLLIQVRNDIASHLDDGRVGEHVRDGVRVALIGAPNVGKSTWLNALTGEDAAIVTPIAGTTRDVVRARTTLGGQLVILEDTAGLRATQDVVEAEGVRRAEARAGEAAIRIGVVDATRPETWAAPLPFLREGDLLLVNKSDVVEGPGGGDGPEAPVPSMAVSALSGPDLERVRAALEGAVQRVTAIGAAPVLTRARHRAALRRALEPLDQAATHMDETLAAEELRVALGALDEVLGRADVEDVLDRVFSSFCIGK